MNQHVSTVTEVINRNIVVTLLLQRGDNVFLPVYDDGIDFIVHRRSDDLIMKVQLKDRWTIDRTYSGRDTWIAFPHQGSWFLVPHETLVETVPDGVAASFSWLQNGRYSTAAPSAKAMAALAPYRLNPLADPERVAGHVPAPAAAADAQGRSVWQDFADIRGRSLPVSLSEILDFRDEGRR